MELSNRILLYVQSFKVIIAIKTERFLLFFGDAQLLLAMGCASRVRVDAAMHLNYRMHLAFGF